MGRTLQTIIILTSSRKKCCEHIVGNEERILSRQSSQDHTFSTKEIINRTLSRLKITDRQLHTQTDRQFLFPYKIKFIYCPSITKC